MLASRLVRPVTSRLAKEAAADIIRATGQWPLSGAQRFSWYSASPPTASPAAHSLALPARARLLVTSARVCKSRRSSAEAPAPDVVDEVPVVRTKGKGAKGVSHGKKGAKSKTGQKEDGMLADDSRSRTTTTNTELEGERFDEAGLKTQMERMVNRCRETVAQIVGSHGRADPAILDNVRVNVPASDRPGPTKSRTASGPSYSLKQFATVGVRDGALIVTCFDADSVKHVERAIYQSVSGLAPQHVPDGEPGVLRIPIPRPTAESRKALLGEVNRVCENARTSIRVSRQVAQKQIRNDTKKGIVGNDEGHKEMKKMEEETKKRTADIDQLEEQMKKRVEKG